MFELLYPILDDASECYPSFNKISKLATATHSCIAYAANDTDTWSIFRDLASSQAQSLQVGGP